MKYADGLETPRMVTRFLEVNDVVNWIPYFADPVNCSFMPNPDNAAPETRAERWIGFALDRYKENRLGLQALISKENKEFLGMCGLLLQEVNGEEKIEVGYHLLRKHWGNGYAIEAAKMFRDHGFRTLNTDHIISLIHPHNYPSQNVAFKNGMKLAERGVSFKGIHADVFKIHRSEWVAYIDGAKSN